MVHPPRLCLSLILALLPGIGRFEPTVAPRTPGLPLPPRPAPIAPGLGAETPEQAPANEGLHDPWNRLLARHVRAESVDYLTLRESELATLDAYLDRLAAIPQDGMEGDARLALWINAYNATMVREVALRLVEGWSVDQREFAFFEEPLVRLGGERLSLNQLENQWIRVRYKDPRIHAALVCAAQSCPPLLAAAFRPEQLSDQLDERMVSFVRDPTRNRFADGRAQVSKIFEWYADDFGSSESERLAYIARVRGEPVRARRIEYLEYSWRLNLLIPAGTWYVPTSAAIAARHGWRPGEILRAAPAAETASQPPTSGGPEDTVAVFHPKGGARVELPANALRRIHFERTPLPR